LNSGAGAREDKESEEFYKVDIYHKFGINIMKEREILPYDVLFTFQQIEKRFEDYLKNGIYKSHDFARGRNRKRYILRVNSQKNPKYGDNIAPPCQNGKKLSI